MVAKLKSISRRIHWSLLGKAAIFAFTWYFFPFWLFLLIAFYLFLVPFDFAQSKLVVPFLALMVLTAIIPSSLVYSIIFLALFYYLLLIRDLLVIDRKSAYEILILAISFFLFRYFYEQLGGVGISAVALWYAFLVAAIFGFLVNSYVNCFREERKDSEGEEGYKGRTKFRFAGWISFILIWQFLIAVLFLPLDVLYQSVAIFLLGVFIVDLVPGYVLGESLSRRKLFAVSATTFVLLSLILASARWGI